MFILSVHYMLPDTWHGETSYVMDTTLHPICSMMCSNVVNSAALHVTVPYRHSSEINSNYYQLIIAYFYSHFSTYCSLYLLADHLVCELLNNLPPCGQKPM